MYRSAAGRAARAAAGFADPAQNPAARLRSARAAPDRTPLRAAAASATVRYRRRGRRSAGDRVDHLQADSWRAADNSQAAADNSEAAADSPAAADRTTAAAAPPGGRPAQVTAGVADRQRSSRIALPPERPSQ